MSCDPVSDELISNRIQEMCKKLFVAVNGRGYARCDIRMDDKNNLYMLEINFQAGMLYSTDNPGTGDLILQNDPKGHKTFIDLLLRSAIVNTSLSKHII